MGSQACPLPESLSGFARLDASFQVDIKEGCEANAEISLKVAALRVGGD